MFKDKSILITGGTGSFGKKFTQMVFNEFKPKKVVILSRDEMKQWEMKQQYIDNDNIRFLIGDVRDKDRLYRAFNDIDIVIHAAANKIVPIAERDPFECVKTNIDGAKNVIDASIDCNVKRIIAISTDKASNPSNLYGATKMVSDNLFVNANNYVGFKDTRFAVVRYGNVMGSRGSVIPLFIKMLANNAETIPITDTEMTRFMITLEDGVRFVFNSLEKMQGGEIFVKKLPSMKVVEIANTIAPNIRQEIIGKRPGEKIHEQMISIDDAECTLENDDYYIIIPHKDNFGLKVEYKGKKVHKGFSYSSDVNDYWMKNEELIKWIGQNKEIIGSF